VIWLAEGRLPELCCSAIDGLVNTVIAFFFSHAPANRGQRRR
jgi:hypothetical protein